MVLGDSLILGSPESREMGQTYLVLEARDEAWQETVGRLAGSRGHSWVACSSQYQKEDIKCR
jgi:hypothetical protein